MLPLSLCDTAARCSVPGGLWFTGFKPSQTSTILTGQLLWRGWITFPSGRRVHTFWYAPVFLAWEELAGRREEDVIAAVASSIQASVEAAERIRQSPGRTGYLVTNARARKVQSVEWLEWQAPTTVEAMKSPPWRMHRSRHDLAAQRRRALAC